MRANTGRAAALDFGKLADHYDAGRMAYRREFVPRTARRLGMAASARRMEIGAGTGQLTGALLAAGGEVLAVEPSEPMAERLRQNHAAEVSAGRCASARSHSRPWTQQALSRSASCGAAMPGIGSTRSAVTASLPT